MHLAAIASLLLLSTQAPAIAEPAPAKPVKAKKVCKEDEAMTGSRLAKRVCKTAAEWAAERADSSEGGKRGTN